MRNTVRIEVDSHPIYGTLVKVYDIEVGDQFDDFLIENGIEDYSTKPDFDYTVFYLGKDRSVSDTLLRVEAFKESYEARAC